MTQSRAMSAMEAVTNVVVGYGMAVGLQLALFPVLSPHPTLGQSLKIVAWFTVLSLVRGYGLRRLFERLRARAPG